MDKTLLVVKNLPNDFSNLQEYFRTSYGAISTKSFGRCRAIVRFPTEYEATVALHNLHQSKIFGKTISAEYVGSRREDREEPKNDERSASDNVPRITEFVKNLYATSTKFGFEQPPPPYLKYCYPKINRSILDSISIALLSNSKFYTQVLHLMNRMNLEPPFLIREKPFNPPGELRDAQTQTDFDQTSKNLVASDESELESDEQEEMAQLSAHILPMKRKKLDSLKLKKKARKILTSQLNVKQHNIPQRDREEILNKVFEINEKSNIGAKISMNVTSLKLPEKEEISSIDSISSGIEHYASKVPADTEFELKTKVISAEELKSNRVPETQMKDLTIFKNYKRGEPSNKLYIKNLNKNVTEADLRLIYETYKTDGSISIKLMQQGRMKGQAFITFGGDKDNVGIAQKALSDTNGYILKNKPMVVCFGKTSS